MNKETKEGKSSETTSGVRTVVDEIRASLRGAVPVLVARLGELAAAGAAPPPELPHAAEGVARAGDVLAAVCTRLAEDDYAAFAEVAAELTRGAATVTAGSAALRSAMGTLGARARASAPREEIAPVYADVAAAARSLAATCAHVLAVVYGAQYRRAALLAAAVTAALPATPAAAADADEAALQAYADAVGAACTQASELGVRLDDLADDERDAAAAAQLRTAGAQVQTAADAFLDAANAFLGAEDDASSSEARTQTERAREALIAEVVAAQAIVATRIAVLAREREEEQAAQEEKSALAEKSKESNEDEDARTACQRLREVLTADAEAQVDAELLEEARTEYRVRAERAAEDDSDGTREAALHEVAREVAEHAAARRARDALDAMDRFENGVLARLEALAVCAQQDAATLGAALAAAADASPAVAAVLVSVAAASTEARETGAE